MARKCGRPVQAGASLCARKLGHTESSIAVDAALGPAVGLLTVCLEKGLRCASLLDTSSDVAHMPFRGKSAHRFGYVQRW